MKTIPWQIFPWQIFRLVFLVAITASTAKGADFLIDVDFGGDTPSGKTGTAAIGLTANDFWNVYLRNDGAGGWRYFGALSDLKTSTGATTPVGMTVANAPGAWSSGSTDLMYNDYIYPFGGNATITLTGLPAGVYNLYAYAGDAFLEATVGSQSYGVKQARDYPLSNPPAWTEGTQYARFGGIGVNSGQDLVLTVFPGLDGYAVIAGLQLQAVPEPSSAVLTAGGFLAAIAWRRRR